MILVVAYLRTGSTFTASLFTHQPNSFYVFEPLHMLHDKSSKGEKINFLNGTVRYVQMCGFVYGLCVFTFNGWFEARL